jgi:hypothetical protein
MFRGDRFICPICNMGVYILFLLNFSLSKEGLPFWRGFIVCGILSVVPILDSIYRVIHGIVGFFIS